MFNNDGVLARNRKLGNDRPRGFERAPVENLNPPVRPAPQETAAVTDLAMNPRAPETKTEEAGSRLIVGPNIRLKGAEITECDLLVVEGRVEASMVSRVIQIAEGGTFSGTAGIDEAEIRGRFEGEITVRKRLVVRATGRVHGKVRYGSLTVEDGGELCGDVASLTKGEQPAHRPHPIAASTSAGDKVEPRAVS